VTQSGPIGRIKVRHYLRPALALRFRAAARMALGVADATIPPADALALSSLLAYAEQGIASRVLAKTADDHVPRQLESPYRGKLFGHEPQHVVAERDPMDDRGPTGEGILRPISEPTVRKARSIVRRGDGEDGPDLPPYGVCLLTPRSAIEGPLYRRQAGRPPRPCCGRPSGCAPPPRASLYRGCPSSPFRQGIRGMCRAGHDRYRVAEPLLERPPQNRDHPFCKVVEPAKAREAQEAWYEDHYIRRINFLLPVRAPAASFTRPFRFAACRDGSSFPCTAREATAVPIS
jgi:hypothetical protein